MSPNKYWDEQGNCRNCGQPPETHAPKDLRDHRNGVRCCFDKDGHLLPHMRRWIRPIVMEAIREFRKTDNNDSLVERTELAKVTLQHRGEVARINAQWSSRVTTLEEALRETHRDWEQFNAESLIEQSRVFRSAVEDRDCQIKDLAEELEKLKQVHLDETVEIYKEHEKKLAELTAKHDRALEMAINNIDKDRRKQREINPPPVPANSVAKKAQASVRAIGPEDIAKYGKSIGKNPLPGISEFQPNTLQVVTGGKK